MWIKDNWFKIVIILLGVLFASVYFCIRIQEHNLDVANSIRLCANLKQETEGFLGFGSLADRSEKDCIESAKKNYIFKY